MVDPVSDPDNSDDVTVASHVRPVIMLRSRSLGSNDSQKTHKPCAAADALWRHLRRSVSSLQIDRSDLSPNHKHSVTFSFEDSVSAVRLQEQLRDAQRKLERERNARTTIETKKNHIEQERAELVQSVNPPLPLPPTHIPSLPPFFFRFTGSWRKCRTPSRVWSERRSIWSHACAVWSTA